MTHLDIGDGSGGAVDGLDTDTVVRVGDGAVLDQHSLDDVVRAASDRADGETVATAAGAAGEGDVGTRVDGKAVILVLYDSARDVNTRLDETMLALYFSEHNYHHGAFCSLIWDAHDTRDFWNR